MARFLLTRLVALLLTVFVAVTVVFFAIRLVPGDPILAMRGEGTGLLSADVINALREKHGLNAPLPVQYLKFMVRLLTTGDLGESFVNRQSVTENLATAWPYTFRLAIAATLLFVAIGMPLGVSAAIRQGTIWDTGIMGLAVIGVSLPYFFTGLFFMYVFAYRIGWFPVSGADTWAHLVLPAVSLGLISAAAVARFSRATMLEVLHLEYVRTARAKGLRERIVNYHHALRNALIPLVTVIGLQFGLLMSGSIITEAIFSWPGLGHLLVRSILQRDYQMVQGAIMLFAATIALVNLVVDLLYGYLDPRIKYG